MNCSRCADLCQDVPIRTPGELKKVIGVIAANLADGTIIEINGDWHSTPFAELTGQTQPDFISADFKCAECGKVFNLRCETYHGRGGKWSPA